jgi:aldehyde dehydrogenase (NAD+)
MIQVYKNYINGQWMDSQSGQTFEDKNPANIREILGLFPRSMEKDATSAVEAARASFDAWRKVPAPKRAEIMYRVAEKLIQRKEELAQLMTQEMGKVLKETRGDVQEAIDMTYYIAGEGRRLFGETTPSELPNKFAMSLRMPVGVVVAITPWNFPMAIPSWKLIPALVCGNTVVFKPAEDTPLIATKFVEILIEAGVPKGVLNLVHGYGEEVGAALVAHPGVGLVSFTGSSETGRQVAIKCAEGHKRVSLEMGGKNAIIIMDDANIDLAVEGAIWGTCGTTGQRCTASSRLVVHKKVLKEFTDKFVAQVKKLKLGNGLLPGTDVGPVINEKQLNRIHRYTQIAKEDGIQILTGGDIYKEGVCAQGYFYLPTVFAGVSPQSRIAQEEIFGPCPAIISTDSLEEAINIVNNSKYGLSSAIYTQDVNKAFTAIQDLYTGITYINSSTIGAEVHLPFGGTRQTGNGHREGGHVLDVFTEWKTVYVDYSGKLQKAQIDT